jgi:hypothetical protein
MGVLQPFDKVLSFPYNAELLDDGTYDRVFDASDFAQDRHTFLSDGVFIDPVDNFKVYATNANMTVTVGAVNGTNTAFIIGHSFTATGQQIFDIPTASTSFNRIDSITLKHSNLSDKRDIELLYNTGAASASPSAPALVRNADEYEIQLAIISVPANATIISQQNVTDMRLNTAVCGIVVYLGKAVDPTGLFDQYQDYLNSQMAAWDDTKAQQASDWENQFGEQQATFTNWYGAAQSDIATLAQFDFDNLVMYPSNVKSTAFNADGSILETLTNVTNNLLRAARTTTFNSDGSITTDFKLYDADGVTVMLHTVTNTTFNSDGSITDNILAQ